MDLKEAKITNFRIYKRHPWELARFHVILYFVKQILKKNKKKNITILDIGCGDTFVIDQLSRHIKNISFLAVDQGFNNEIMNEYKKTYSAKNVKISFYKNINQLNNGDMNAVDIVLLLDVIEHIEDDSNFFKELSNHKLIDNKTNIIITVPAFQNIFSEHDVFMGHYRRYSQKSLVKLILPHNFVPQKKGYFFFILLIIRSFTKLLEKISGPKTVKGVGDYNLNSLISLILNNVLIFDFKIIQFLKRIGVSFPGLSTYVICKKSV